MDNYFKESLYSYYGQEFLLKKMLFEHREGLQHLAIFESEFFGRVLSLDGIIQTTEADEFMYHEMMVHVPILSCREVKKVLIIGGGDGGILREVVKHQQVETITMVEIDKAVVDMCCEYLPRHSDGAFEDPRLELVIGDGAEFVKQTEGSFDVIISDSTDPVGPGEVLFDQDFYTHASRILAADGMMVTQNGVPFYQPQEVTNTYQRMQRCFASNGFYTVAVPTYVGGVMTLAWARKLSLAAHQESLLLERIANNLQHSGLGKTKYYSPEVHRASFALPEYIKNLLV